MRTSSSSVRRDRSLEELLYPSENADSGIVSVLDLLIVLLTDYSISCSFSSSCGSAAKRSVRLSKVCMSSSSSFKRS